MSPEYIREFPVTVKCPIDFTPRKVWVRELILDSTHLVHPNGCDSCSGHPACKDCLTAVYNRVISDR